MTLVAEARAALREAMAADSRVVVLGEDVRAGGPFGLTKDLADAFPDRVRNTPISEAAVMGAAVGMALGGARPVVDLMFDDFVTLAADQLFNHAAKTHYLSGGRYSVPLVVWTVGGAGTRWGAQHSQRLDGHFAQVPGLKVLAPASPKTAALCLRAALEDPDPVVVLADRALLYRREELPVDPVDPWRAQVVRRGTALTIAATGRLVHLAFEAAAEVMVDVEVIDLRRLAPLDVATVVESVRRTGRLLVLHDEAATGALAATLAARVQQLAFRDLRAPIRIVTSPPTPVPAAASLEDAYLLDSDRIALAISELKRA